MPLAESKAPVATIAVPSKLSQKALAELRQQLEWAVADDSVRVLVLRGSQSSFCAGMDLGEIALDSGDIALDAAAPLWEQGARDFTAALQTILLAKPITVALVEGPAMGGGVGLLSACDLVLATEQATFALPELLLGLVPAIILPILAERLGLHQAKRWAITQATWQAGEAQTRGLADQLVASDRVEASLKRTLRTLLRVHPRGVIALKRYTRLLQSMDSISGMNQHSETASPAGTEPMSQHWSVILGMQAGQKLLVSLLRQPEVRADVIAFRDFGILPGQADS